LGREKNAIWTFIYAGLKEMVDEVRALLKSRGFDRKQIFYEKYDLMRLAILILLVCACSRCRRP